MKKFAVNEVFYSLQGEGGRAGEASVFVRLQGCNLRCDIEEGPLSPGGWRCDTEFESGRLLTGDELVEEIGRVGGACRWIVFTGGEPALQLNKDADALLAALKDRGYRLAIETNGTVALPDGMFDWITVSPKTAEHTLRQLTASEVKYVRHHGQGVPHTRVKSPLRYLSPAFEGSTVDRSVLTWVIGLCKEHADWRLSVQQHKWWGVR